MNMTTDLRTLLVELNALDMLEKLGIDTDDLYQAAKAQIKHDFIYYWMQISWEEPESVMREAWDDTELPNSVDDMPAIWYAYRDNSKSAGAAHLSLIQSRCAYPCGRIRRGYR